MRRVTLSAGRETGKVPEAGGRIDRGRRVLLSGLGLTGLGLLAGCGVRAPEPRPRRIGFVDFGSSMPTVDVFREGLRDLGWVEGQSFTIEYRNAEGDLERLPALVAELVALPVEVLVVSNTVGAQAAVRATSTIPIVAENGNIVAAGLVANLAHPEGNLTGLATNSESTVGKRVELLKEAVPTMSRLAAIVDPRGPGWTAFLQELRRAGQVLQLDVKVYEVRDLDELAAPLATARADGAQGLVVLAGGVIGSGADPRLARAALAAGLPSVAEPAASARNGGLLSFGVDQSMLPRRAAVYVDKLLKGARPADLPVELPTTFSVVVNLRTAQALGVTVPDSVLQQATEVIR